MPETKFASKLSAPDTKASELEELRQENHQLRELVIQLSKLVISNVVNK